MPAQSGLITVMQRAVRKVAPRLRRDFGEVEQLQVSRKGPADFVTNADRRVEGELRAELGQARPGWGFLLEEGGAVAGEPGKPRWIIDPIDGTSNFMHGIPHFAVAIAVEEPRAAGGWGEITQGLVYNPITDETFWAEKGRGAWLHDRRLRVSSRRDPADSLIATGVPFKGHGDHARFERVLRAVAPEVAGIRRFGSAALDLAWVAAGRFDGYWEQDVNVWDTAAGTLLVREAGGFVTDFRGGDQSFERKEYLAAGDALHGKLLKLVAGALRGA